MEDHQLQSSQRGRAGGAVGLISLHRLSFGYFWVGNSFACFGRGVLLWGFYVRPWVFGLILGLFGGPRAVSLMGQDGEKVAFLSYSCGEVGWFVFCILPLHKLKSLHLVSTVWTAPALARGISGGRSLSPGRGEAKMLLSRQGRTLPREEGGVQERNSVHSPAQAGPKASRVGSGEAAVTPPWAEGTPLGRHHQPSMACEQCPRRRRSLEPARASPGAAPL